MSWRSSGSYNSELRHILEKMKGDERLRGKFMTEQKKIALGSTGLPVTEVWQEEYAKLGYPYGYKVPCPHCGQPMKPPADTEGKST